MSDNPNAKQIAALQFEREGYVARGLTDRIQQVDKQLSALGAKAEKPAKKADSGDAPKKETAAQKKAREAAEAEQAAAEAQAQFDALSDDDKAALAALTEDELKALVAVQE